MERPVMYVGSGTSGKMVMQGADVGVATATFGVAEAGAVADVVMLQDDLDGVSEAMEIAQKTTRVARRSVKLGLGGSVILMVVAGLGFVPVLVGAVLGGCLNVVAIGYAMRAGR